MRPSPAWVSQSGVTSFPILPAGGAGSLCPTLTQPVSAPGPSQIIRKREKKHQGSCSRRRLPLPVVCTLTKELVLHKHRCDRAHTLFWSDCVRNHVYGPPQSIHGTPCSSIFQLPQGAPLDWCVQLTLRSCAPLLCCGAQRGYTAAYLGDPRARASSSRGCPGRCT